VIAERLFDTRRHFRRDFVLHIAWLPYRSVAFAKAITAAAALGVFASFTSLSATGLLEVAIISRFHIGNVQKPVAADTEVHKRRLDAGFDIDDSTLVDVADVAFMAGPFYVQFFEHSIFKDGDSTLLWLKHIDEHFLLHTIPYELVVVVQF